MQTDYKISRTTRNDDGSVEVVARIYEGEVAAADEWVGSEMTSITRYRRTRQLREVTLRLPDLPLRASDAQIRTRLKAELAKDSTRTPIAEQR